MASKILIAFMALFVVAMAIELEDEMTLDEIAADMEFIKRDPYMQEFFTAEKRGNQMKKYKLCPNQINAAQQCWCSRRSGKLIMCTERNIGSI